MLFQYLLLVLILLAIIMVKRRPKKLLDLHSQLKVNFPYIPVIGHAFKFIGNNADRMALIDELGRQAHAHTHGMVSFWFAHYLCVSISDPVAASCVLRTCSDKWPATTFMRHILGNGSVFAEEKIWQLRRKILTPMFASKYYDNFVRVFERNTQIMMQELAAAAGTGDVSMWEPFSSYALHSALEMTFGESANAPRNVRHPFVTAFVSYLELGAARFSNIWLHSTALYRLLPAAARQKYNKRVAWGFIHSLITNKKKAILEEKLKETKQDGAPNTADARSKTFLELLIELSGGERGYTDVELREETLVLIVASTDTTATAACFAAVLLANHPEVQDRVYEEIREILGNSERSISLDDLENLKYLDAVVKETLRLYPPVPITLRKCNKDLELPSGLVLPAGCEVLLNIWGVHRNPCVWGADATQFRPERFLRATPHQLAAFMPFGHGPRNCTGTRLALASLKLSLAELTRRYRLAPALRYQYTQHTPLKLTFEFTLKHVHNFNIRIREILENSERSISLDDLENLKYLDAVVKETLRLYPPVPITLRKCNKDLELPSGLVLPAGCEVLLNIWGVHRNPRVWGADATQFRPERFLSATPHQLAAFMPFGHGPRNCTGTRLALASLKLSLAELTRRYRLAPALRYQYSAHAPLKLTFEFTLKHVHNFNIRLENRINA